MQSFLKKGFSHPFILILVVIILVLLASPFRRYVYVAYQLLGSKIGINLNNIASDNYVTWIKNQADELENAPEGVFLNRKVAFKDSTLAQRRSILGQHTGPGGEKWIEIDLSEQRIYMKEGGNTVGSFLVSTGKWAPTPKGEWRIWTKLRYTRMRGGSKALGTFYDLPNVPYVMYYYQGYGVHGAYWHNDFGRPRSHGCTNMKPEEAAIVFNWANVGTRVVVHE